MYIYIYAKIIKNHQKSICNPTLPSNPLINQQIE